VLIHHTPTDTYSGIAMRIQKIKNKKPYNTFTIRMSRTKNQIKSNQPTEYRKRMNAIKNNCLYPKYTLQCYVDDKNKILSSAAIIETKDLYKYIKKHKHHLIKSNHEYNNKGDENKFIVIPWMDVNHLLLFSKNKQGKIGDE